MYKAPTRGWLLQPSTNDFMSGITESYVGLGVGDRQD